MPIPVIVNAAAGAASSILEALRSDARVVVEEIQPTDVARVVASHAAQGVDRVLVAGGDGTLATAAAALVGTPAALGLIPGGTLNHFARALNIPLAPKEALDAALAGSPTTVDVGFLNDRLFLNTSSVGVYVAFVRCRERWKRWFGYLGGSVIAMIQTFVRLRSFAVEVKVASAVQHLYSPLIFIGVGEREFALPQLGERKPDGQRGLHVLIVRHTTRRGLLAMGLRTLFKGIRPWTLESEVISTIVDDFRITLPHSRRLVSVDGEVIEMHNHLHYRFQPGALNVIVPPSSGSR